ncbi:hypothetical protein RclHR1_13020006 [Rhizophagus clarus]|uniref:Uncharacterized protein n=1 Tax=Rhizophagus clarus TaxID=94130 RepID=A0A2Z6Q906_9GLOM|nr:hypothetical protein RclHR1_13020006 [Rhizophagus clarus]GES97247.1 hypothetical protein GLOIN_2v1678875 [Rhizophagus clarus]
MELKSSDAITTYKSDYDDIINDPLYKEIKLNEKLTEELKFSETLCNQFNDILGKYYQGLQNNFNNINNILGEKQELKEMIGDLDDHNSKLVKILVENLEEKSNVIKEKDKEIQEKNKIIQEKDNFIKGKDKLIQEQIKEFRNMQEEYSEIQKVVKKQTKEIKKIQKKDSTIQEKDNEIQELIKKFQEKDDEIQELVKKIQEKDNKIQDLEQDNYKLKNEACEYQYVPGVATNFPLSDDDKYNSIIKLKDDVINLQHSLENYVTKCKDNVEINISEVQDLLKKYGSDTIVTIDQKPLIEAVLQRHVIEQIFMYGEEYFDLNNLLNHEKHGYGIETHLYHRTYDLIQLAEVIVEKRDGVDKSLPIKLRQEVFAALGDRGFNNIIDNKETFPHEFISYYQVILNEEIGKYRTLKDLEKKREVEDMAGEIIKEVVTLFWFRLEVQEPVAQYYWFNYNDYINPSYMEGTWEDDEIDYMAVDICYFPLIGCNNELKRQVYTPARALYKRKCKTV